MVLAPEEIVKREIERYKTHGIAHVSMSPSTNASYPTIDAFLSHETPVLAWRSFRRNRQERSHHLGLSLMIVSEKGAIYSDSIPRHAIQLDPKQTLIGFAYGPLQPIYAPSST